MEIILIYAAFALLMAFCLFAYNLVSEMLTMGRKKKIYAWGTAFSVITAICCLSAVDQIRESKRRQIECDWNPNHTVESLHPTPYDHSKEWNERRDAERQGG